MCGYNKSINCSYLPGSKHCTDCGWNPEVAEARLARIKAELGIRSQRRGKMIYRPEPEGDVPWWIREGRAIEWV